MLDKMKALNDARRMQSKIKKQLEQIFHKEEKGDSYVLVRGDKRIEEIVINGEDRKDIKDLINDATKQVDKKVEKNMRDQAGDVMSMLGM
jgi:DNA-binding protein YbaB